MLHLSILYFFIIVGVPPLVSRQVGFFANIVGWGVCWGVVLVVRSRGCTNATRNLHFFAELGVLTPNLSQKMQIYSAEKRGPEI